MKYYTYQLLTMLPFAIVIILTREINGLFGFVIGAALIMYSYVGRYFMDKRDEVEAEKAYAAWQAEMSDRLNQKIGEW